MDWLQVLNGYLILNLGTYLISLFYTVVLRGRARSLGFWFWQWNKMDNAKTIFSQQVVTTVFVIVAFLPAVLLQNVIDGIESEDRRWAKEFGVEE